MTAEDIFDVVDEHDEVIGQERRSIVHKNQWLHRAVHIFVRNSKGLIFLQKRSLSKDLHPGVWTTSCCGHVDTGETYDQAAYRELDEELGIKNSVPLQWLLKESPSPETTYEFINVYLMSYDGELNLNPEEISEGKWVDPSALQEIMQTSPSLYAPALKRLWDKVESMLS